MDTLNIIVIAPCHIPFSSVSSLVGKITAVHPSQMLWLLPYLLSRSIVRKKEQNIAHNWMYCLSLSFHLSCLAGDFFFHWIIVYVPLREHEQAVSWKRVGEAAEERNEIEESGFHSRSKLLETVIVFVIRVKATRNGGKLSSIPSPFSFLWLCILRWPTTIHL